MTDPAEGLRTLLELPPSQPLPLHQLLLRVDSRRRRRRAFQAALSGVAVVLAGVATVPLLDRPSGAPSHVIAAGPGLPEVARAAAGGSTLVLVADEECAYLRSADGIQLAGGCATGPADHSVQTFGPPVRTNDGVTATILRGGPSMARFSVRLADDRTIDGSMTAGGWALVVADGTIVGVSGIDHTGHPVPEYIVS